MVMLQNAKMFQDSAPAAPPTSGRGGASSSASSEGNDRFAEMLRGRQPSRDAGVAKKEATKLPASRPTALPPHNPPVPRATDGAQHSQQAAAGDASKARSRRGAGDKAGAGGTAKGPDRREKSADLPRYSLAADAQETAGAADAAQQRKDSPVAAVATTTQEEVVSDLERNSLAAEAQENGAAQQGMAGGGLATAKESRPVYSAVEQDAGVAGAAGTSGVQGATGGIVAENNGPAGNDAGFTAAPGAAAVQNDGKQEAAPFLATLPSSSDAKGAFNGRIPAAPGSAALGEPAPQGVEDAAAGRAKSGPITVVRKGQDAASPEGVTTPAALPDPLQSAGSQGAAAVTGAAPDLAAAQPDSAAGTGRVMPGMADGKGLHGAEGHRSPHAAQGLTEEAPSSEAPVEVSGTSGAPTAGTAKFVPFQGSAGQGGFSDAEKKGHPEQKAQGNGGDQVQPQGLGSHAAVAAEASQAAETKPAATLKSALHESILSQVREGVVTHDGKGNGQMSIRLNPGELGELKIMVRMEDNRLRVEVQADNRMVKDLLMSNLDSLKQSLTSKDFTMEGFEVSTGGGGFNTPLPEQKEGARQQSSLRSAKAGGYPDQVDDVRVNYLTGEVNNLLDVRF
jgi:flagellar hook-length control protein FliK